MTRDQEEQRRKIIKPGDKVTRLLAGTVPMELTVTSVDDRFIHCGSWKFDKIWGYEVDEELGWGVPADGGILTGSYLVIENDS